MKYSDVRNEAIHKFSFIKELKQPRQRGVCCTLMTKRYIYGLSKYMLGRTTVFNNDRLMPRGLIYNYIDDNIVDMDINYVNSIKDLSWYKYTTGENIIDKLNSVFNYNENAVLFIKKRDFLISVSDYIDTNKVMIIFEVNNSTLTLNFLNMDNDIIFNQKKINIISLDIINEKSKVYFSVNLLYAYYSVLFAFKGCDIIGIKFGKKENRYLPTPIFFNKRKAGSTDFKFAYFA